MNDETFIISRAESFVKERQHNNNCQINDMGSYKTLILKRDTVDDFILHSLSLLCGIAVGSCFNNNAEFENFFKEINNESEGDALNAINNRVPKYSNLLLDVLVFAFTPHKLTSFGIRRRIIETCYELYRINKFCKQGFDVMMYYGKYGLFRIDKFTIQRGIIDQIVYKKDVLISLSQDENTCALYRILNCIEIYEDLVRRIRLAARNHHENLDSIKTTWRECLTIIISLLQGRPSMNLILDSQINTRIQSNNQYILYNSHSENLLLAEVIRNIRNILDNHNDTEENLMNSFAQHIQTQEQFIRENEDVILQIYSVIKSSYRAITATTNENLEISNQSDGILINFFDAIWDSCRLPRTDWYNIIHQIIQFLSVSGRIASLARILPDYRNGRLAFDAFLKQMTKMKSLQMLYRSIQSHLPLDSIPFENILDNDINDSNKKFAYFGVIKMDSDVSISHSRVFFSLINEKL